MELFFKIDEDYLLKHTLHSKADKIINVKFTGVLNEFQKFALDKNRRMYEAFLAGHYDEKVIVYLEDIKKSAMFRRIVVQTQDFMRLLRDEWSKDQEKTLKIMEKITGINLDTEFDVIVTHPGILNEEILDEKKIAFGGWRIGYTHMLTIHLWNMLMKAVFADNIVQNSIREMVVLDELRIQLNLGKYPPFAGSAELEKIKNLILPIFKKYMHIQVKHLPSLVQECEILYKIEKTTL